MKILALDLGKYKSVACFYDTESKSETYDKIDTYPQPIHDLILKLNPDRLVIEVGTAAGWIHDLAQALELECQVANPHDERWHWRKVKTKTDRTDAFKLAKLSAIDELPMVTIAPRADRQLKKLIRYRTQLVQRRTQIQNTVRSLFDAEGIAIPTGAKAWSVAGRDGLSEYARPLDGLTVDHYWRGLLHEELAAYATVDAHIKRVEKTLADRAESCADTIRLRTIPGVGERLSEALVAVIGDPHRFKTAKHVSSYVGLTPRVHQSGEMARMGRISKRGDRGLRTLLVEVAWISRRYNPVFAHLHEHLVGGSKTRRKKATVALARRILVIAWAMLKHQTDWDPSRVGPAPRGPALATG